MLYRKFQQQYLFFFGLRPNLASTNFPWYCAHASNVPYILYLTVFAISYTNILPYPLEPSSGQGHPSYSLGPARVGKPTACHLSAGNGK